MSSRYDNIEILEEGFIVHQGATLHGKTATIEGRVYGAFMLDGVRYEFDRVIKIRGKKEVPR